MNSNELLSVTVHGALRSAARHPYYKSADKTDIF